MDMTTTVPQPAPVTQPCFVLQNSAMCPNMNGYYILSSPASNITDSTSFDSYIMMMTGPMYIKTLQTQYGCPNFNGKGIRFYTSVLCNYFADYSLQTCPVELTSTITLPPRNPLCQSSCQKWMDSINTMFRNPSICTQTTDPMILANRSTLTTPGWDMATQNVFYEYCLMTLTNNQPCSVGVGNEATNLGFNATIDAALACVANATIDTGCGDLVNAFQAAVVQLLNPISSLPWIASGGAWGAMILFYLLFVVMMPMKGWKRYSSIAHQPLAPIAEPEVKYSGTIARSNGKTIRRSEIMNKNRGSVFGRLSFFGGNGGGRKEPPPLPISTEYTTRAPNAAYLSPDREDSSNLIQRMRVIESYPAQLNDELALVRGDIIIIDETFDDGWAVGRNEATGASGAVPLSCLVPVIGGGGNGRSGRRSVITARTASLYSGVNGSLRR